MTPRGRRVHFSGIGGTGMVAVARLAIEAGWEVRGSDNPLYPPSSEMVASLGVPVYEGYAAENLDWDPEQVVIGNALSRGNAEVEAVLERNLHYVSFPEWLKDSVLRDRRPVVIAGTHGKSTTTALTAWLLESAGLDPGFLVGAQPLNFSESSRLGAKGATFVVEGDEYDTAFFDKRAKFFHYLPQIAVVTSLEFDHGDIYRDLDEIETAFARMLRQVPTNGKVLLCADDVGALELRERAFSPVETYGFDADAFWRIEPGGLVENFETFSIYRDGAAFGEFASPLIGRYNQQNAAAAIAVASTLGADANKLAEGLRSFRGLKRRMETFHTAAGITFIEDFAHHPTAIRGTVQAACARWPESRVLALFEPRSNTSVTNRMQNELARSFTGAARVWIGPVHRAESIPETERLNRPSLVDHIDAPATYSDDISELVAELKKEARAGDVVLVMSNGAFGGIYELIRAAFN